MIAIDNLNVNGGTVDLTGIYKQLNNLNQSVSSLESLTSLSSLSDDILSLSTSFKYFTDAMESVVLPVIFSNSSSIDSLSNSFNEIDIYLNDSVVPSIYSLNSSILNINSSLASLQQSYSDITNSLSTLTGGGGLLTNSTFNYQAFNTTYDLGKYLHLTGDFSLNNASSINASGGDWNLSQLGTNYSFSSFTISNLQHFTLNNFASFNSNNLGNINKFSINGETIQSNIFTSINFASLEANLLNSNSFTSNCKKITCNCNTISNNLFSQGMVFCGNYGSWESNTFKYLDTVNFFCCSSFLRNGFSRCKYIEFNNCIQIKALSFTNVSSFISFKNNYFVYSDIGSFYHNGVDYTCSLIFENCVVRNSTEESAFTKCFTTLHSGINLIYSFR